jgi:hypothetical protein
MDDFVKHENRIPVTQITGKTMTIHPEIVDHSPMSPRSCHPQLGVAVRHLPEGHLVYAWAVDQRRQQMNNNKSGETIKARGRSMDISTIFIE